ncbi:MAG: prepilin-type N-terminal cleavage/methylation domain-containing protein [Patescibacteria group bacterium]
MISILRWFRTHIKEERSGFTLIELLLYAVIFAISSVFLVNILTTITQTEVRQNSINGVSQQVSFVADTVQRLVRQASLIENPAGVASTTLALRMTATSTDKTTIYTDASSTGIFLKQVDINGVATTIPLTDSNVTVGNFTITKFETAGGPAIVQVDLTLNYNTTIERAKIARSWHGAITRISAATFDSNLVPNSSNSYDLGGSGSTWKDGYFAGNAYITGKLGVAGASLAGTLSAIKSAGDVGFSSSSYGVVLVSPNTTCYRLGVSNAGLITTTTVTCP